MPKPEPNNLVPRLIVNGAADAITFYQQTLAAELLERFEDRKLGIVVHSVLQAHGGTFAVVDSAPDFHNYGPQDIGGSPVLLHLMVDDPDTVGRAMQARGGQVIFPIADQFYGHREGRLRDPFGHLWIIGKVIEQLSDEEIQRRVDRFHD